MTQNLNPVYFDKITILAIFSLTQVEFVLKSSDLMSLVHLIILLAHIRFDISVIRG